jgi:hypothetical protein
MVTGVRARVQSNWFYRNLINSDTSYLTQAQMSTDSLVLYNNTFLENKAASVVYWSAQSTSNPTSALQDNVFVNNRPTSALRGVLDLNSFVGVVGVISNTFSNPAYTFEAYLRVTAAQFPAGYNITFNYWNSTTEAGIRVRLLDRFHLSTLATAKILPYYLTSDFSVLSSTLSAMPFYDPVLKQIGGDLNTTLTLTYADGPVYTVVMACYIAATGKLILEPGVTLRFAPRESMQVSGILIANGTTELPITFTSYRDGKGAGATAMAGDWGGVSFLSGSPGAKNISDPNGNLLARQYPVLLWRSQLQNSLFHQPALG